MKLLIVMFFVVVFAGCNMHTPSEQTGYRLACEALQADESVPDSVEVLPIDDAELYIAKNAGYVVVHYKHGSDITEKFVVRLKRVARTWMVEEVVKGKKKN